MKFKFLLYFPWFLKKSLLPKQMERRHSFDNAVAEYERLAALLPMLGYERDTAECAGLRASGFHSGGVVQTRSNPVEVAEVLKLTTGICRLR